MRFPIPLTGPSRIVLAVALAGIPRLAAQEPVRYTLSISHDSTEIGQEVVRIQPAAAGLPATTLTGVARYPALRARVELTGVIERSGDGSLTRAQFDLQTPEHAWRTYVQAGARRLTVRTATEGRESAREYPVDPRTVVLDDSLFTPWIAVAALAGARKTTIRAIWPRTGLRGELTLERSGTPEGGSLVRVTGAAAAEIESGRNGQLVRVILPARGLTAAVVAP
jgi:hypothetical protein